MAKLCALALHGYIIYNPSIKTGCSPVFLIEKRKEDVCSELIIKIMDGRWGDDAS
jgi:hypothetical protein